MSQAHPADIVDRGKDSLAVVFGHVAVKHFDEFVAEVRDLATSLMQIDDLESDIVISSIFLKSAHSYAVHHSMDTSILCAHISREMNYSKEQRLSLLCASLTMNIGMVELQDRVYESREALSPEEKKVVRNHTNKALELLKEAGVEDELWLSIVDTHHEKMDGTGYPNGLQGNDIPELARIVHVADVYAAMVSPRQYRHGMLASDIAKSFLVKYGKSMDVKVSACLIRELGLYPPGSVVKVTSGEYAVVVARGENIMSPVVRILDTKKGLTGTIKHIPDKEVSSILPLLAKGPYLDARVIWCPSSSSAFFDVPAPSPIGLKLALELIKDIKLPSQPEVLFKINGLIKQDEPDLQKIANLVSTDLMISGLTLKSANSPMFNQGNKITSVRHALSFLGIDRFKKLVLTSVLKITLEEHTGHVCGDNDLEVFALGYCCERIADLVHDADGDDAFLCGVFSDSGTLFMSKRFPDYGHVASTRLHRSPISGTCAEMYHYTVHHGLLSYLFSKRWQLPDSVCLAVYYHHVPNLALIQDYHVRTLTAIIGLGSVLVDLVIFARQSTDETQQLYANCMAELCLEDSDIEAIRDDLAGSVLIG
jgi:HD-GYP domain-containing protein (c-di-GMP phosphodiesterase class II)/HD-like signal output (HDOD) protein